MNYRILSFILGTLLLINSGILVIFIVVAISVYPNENQAIPFFIACLISILLAFIGRFLGRNRLDQELTYREGYVVASVGWMLVAFIGALPFYFSGVVSSFTDAYFESISGFTTTGASIFTVIANKGHTLLLWRSFSQWLGGMGIIVLTLAILPTMSNRTMHLFSAEVSGPTPEKLMPRISETARNLYFTYTGLTVLQILLLHFNGMDLFSALCHSFGTLSTGGFSPLNASIGSYYQEQAHPHYLRFETIITLFMFLAGCNFSLHYKFLTGDKRAYWNNNEFRYYLGITLCVIMALCYDLYSTDIYNNFSTIFRHATFTGISILTGTGFATEDYNKWPSFSKSLIIFIMFFGGMAGSTAGGIKIIRVMVMGKEAFNEIRRAIHPKQIITVRLGQDSLSKDVISTIHGFVIIYIIVYFVGVCLLGFSGLDYESLSSMTIACLGNVGPGLAVVGPASNFSSLPDSCKWVLIVFMLLGRLELFPVLTLCLPTMWKK